MQNNLMQIIIFTSFLTIIWPVLFGNRTFIHKIGILAHFLFIIFLFKSLFSLYLSGVTNSFVVNIYKLYSFKICVNRSGLIFGTLLSVLWPAAYFYSIGYLNSAEETNKTRFLVFLNLSIFMGVCLSFAGNLITLFTFYELLSLCTIPLVAHRFSDHVNRSVKKYILYLFGGSICFWLPSIIYINFVSSGSDFALLGLEALKFLSKEKLLILFCLTIFGILKTAIFPFHGWLPAAMAANYPTSSVLHGVLVVNSGIFCLLKSVYEIFGYSIVSDILSQNSYIIIFPLVGVIYSGIMACIQETVKKALAWSTASQLNLMVVIMFSNITFSYALVLHALILHSFCKISLFFSAGCVYTRNRATSLDEFRGVLAKFREVFIVYMIASISLSGIAVLNNGYFKKLLLDSANSFRSDAVIYAIIASSILSVIYLGRVMVEMATNNYEVEENFGRPSKLMVASYMYTASLILIASYFSSEIASFLMNFIAS